MPTSRRIEKPAFSGFLYRYMNLVERFFQQADKLQSDLYALKKHAHTYLALVKFAATRIRVS